jgi:hypothetical protein
MDCSNHKLFHWCSLLVGETAADYDQFFQRIIEEDEFNQESMLTDFESATIKSIKNSFPNASHKGNIVNHHQLFSISCRL